MTRMRNVARFFGSTTQIRALWARTLCRALARTSPSLRVVGTADDGGLLLLFVDDPGITPYGLTTDGYQKRELDRTIEWCERLDLPLGGTFVDVGANVGTTTLLALRSGRFADAICIEPAPANLELLGHNLALNGLEDRVTVLAAGASDAVGRADLYLARANSGDHRLASAASRPLEGRSSVEVATRTLDDALAELGRVPADVSCIWIDTQGFEGFALAGAKDLIDAGVPFVIELWPQGSRDAGCFDLLLDAIESKFDGFVDLGGRDAGRLLPADRVRSFAARFRGRTAHTDLLLVPRGRAPGQ